VTPQVDAITLRLSATELALFFFGRTGRPRLEWENGDDGEGIRLASLPVRQPNAAVQENGTYGGREAKPLAAYRRRLCCLWLVAWAYVMPNWVA
jgi:hypothetical protein